MEIEKRKVGQHGKLRPARNAKQHWTPEEDDYLRQAWGQVSLESIMLHLGRSKAAVRCRRANLGLLPASQATDLLPRSQVLAAMGLVNGSSLRALDGAPFFKKKVSKRKYYVMIEHEALLEFLRTHPTQYDASRIKEGALGIEPEWLVQKRREDAALHRAGIPRKYAWFTEQEDMRLKRLYFSGMPYREIAEKMHRNVGSVRTRCYRLGIAKSGGKSYPPIKRNRKKKGEK